VPQLPAHTATDATPQATLAINSAGTNAAGGLTLSVQVASHDTGSQSSAPSTPNIDALAISVAARSLGGVKQFDIRLDPPELGRVEVRLSIDASGKTQAHMTADQPQTLELLQKDATNLTRALRDAGLDVSQNGLNFSLKGQGQNGGGQSGNFGNASRSLSLPAIAQSIEAAQPTNIPYPLLGNARLDIHV
jgi:chemotaxis protein MotD